MAAGSGQTMAGSNFVYETPPKTRFHHRYLTRVSPQDVQSRVTGNEASNAISPSPSQAGPISPETSGSGSMCSSFSTRLHRKLLNASTPSTPSWHEGVDGPLTPTCARSVNMFLTPRTPPGRKDDAQTNSASKQTKQSPKLVVGIGKTCKKWMKSMARKWGRKTRTVDSSLVQSQSQFSPVLDKRNLNLNFET